MGKKSKNPNLTSPTGAYGCYVAEPTDSRLRVSELLQLHNDSKANFVEESKLAKAKDYKSFAIPK
jgi:hypothetical protein